MRIVFCCLCFLLSVTSTCFSTDVASAVSNDVASAVSNDVASAVSEAIEPFIEAGEISGAVTLVAREERLFDPLGMKDTTFFPSRQQANRLATSYLKNDEVTELTETAISFVHGDLWDTKRTVKPGGGLFSTAEDLRRFYQMMLGGGVWEGKRILNEESVRELTRTQSGNIKTGFTDGMSWGIKFQVVKVPQGVTTVLNPGTFGHGGAFGTQSWADPVNQTIYILMIQRRGFENGDNSPVRMAFQSAVTAALD